MAEELVTIVIPAYNSWPWLKDTIKSANSQTMKCNVLVVDDQSTQSNGHGLIPCQYVTTPSRLGWPLTIRWAVHTQVKTDWFLILNGDDIISPTCVEECWKAAERTGYKIAVPREVQEGVPPPFQAWSNHYWYCALIHKSVWNQLGGYSEVEMADWDFWIRCHIHRIPIASTGKQLFYWVQRPDNETQRLINSGEMPNLIKAMQDRYAWVRKGDPKCEEVEERTKGLTAIPNHV